MKRLREQRGLTQTGLAELVSALGFEWDKQRISRIENGKETVDVDKLVALATVLEVMPGALITDPLDAYGTAVRALDYKWRELAAEATELILRTILCLDLLDLMDDYASNEAGEDESGPTQRRQQRRDDLEALMESVAGRMADAGLMGGLPGFVSPESPGWPVFVSRLVSGDIDGLLDWMTNEGSV